MAHSFGRGRTGEDRAAATRRVGRGEAFGSAMARRGRVRLRFGTLDVFTTLRDACKASAGVEPVRISIVPRENQP